MKIASILCLVLMFFGACRTHKHATHLGHCPEESRIMLDTLYTHLKPLEVYQDNRDELKEILLRLKASSSLIESIAVSGENKAYALVFPLRVVQVIRPNFPNNVVSRERIDSALTILNESLLPAHVQFKLIKYDTLMLDLTLPMLQEDSYEKYYTFSKKYDLLDTCTLYLVDNKDILCENKTCSRTQGFSHILETFTNNVVMDKFFVDDYKALPHEFGHYFGLYHTAETGFGNEKVDGSNCRSAGDKICDTPADPGELYMVYVNYSNCEMKGYKEVGTELEYRPIINNYMSYYYPCYRRGFQFSPRQLEVIFNAAVQVRHNEVIALQMLAGI
jgi:Pregnancy-associated plasma protein-A